MAINDICSTYPPNTAYIHYIAYRKERQMIHVKNVRERLGVSKYRVMKDTGISMNVLIAIENGGDTKVSTLQKIAKALGVNITEFFEEDNNGTC